MLLDYYNLADQPFGVTPDPRYLYFSATHREALASLLYGTTSGRGFTALIAKPGMGKTTLLFDFLTRARSFAKTVFLCQFQCSSQGFLRSLLADLEIEDDGVDFVEMHRKINDCLLRESRTGKQVVVVIDEAQNLTEPVLEIVRMLSNFETPSRKMMHLVLAGQPQLADKLRLPSLAQLRQRISIFARLDPFTEDETKSYINHRLRVAGFKCAAPLFTKQAMEAVAACSEGIPRNINNICFNAMTLGCVARQTSIDADVIREVMDDLDLRRLCLDSNIPSSVQASGPVGLRGKDSRGLAAIWNWTRKLAVSLALVAAIGWPLTRGNPFGMNWHFVRSSQHQHGAGSAPPSPSPTSDPYLQVVALTRPSRGAVSASGPPTTILIRPNDTLSRICIRAFGNYDNNILSRLRELNPWLENPDQIMAGTQIRVYLSPIPSQTSFSMAEQSNVVVPERRVMKP